MEFEKIIENINKNSLICLMMDLGEIRLSCIIRENQDFFFSYFKRREELLISLLQYFELVSKVKKMPENERMSSENKEKILEFTSIIKEREKELSFLIEEFKDIINEELIVNIDKTIKDIMNLLKESHDYDTFKENIVLLDKIILRTIEND